MAFNANQSGLGKTLLARILAWIFDGVETLIGFHADEEELEKQLASGIESGSRVVIIDNVRVARGDREIASGVLERCVTAFTLTFRRLGTNATIVRGNDVVFAVTMNRARLSPDLRRRSLPSTIFEYPTILPIVLLPSASLVNTCGCTGWTFGQSSSELVDGCTGGRPMSSRPAQHSVSNEWAATIDAILQFNGYRGFLTNFDEATSEADPDYHAFVEVCAECYDEPRRPRLEWAQHVTDRGLLREQLVDPSSGFPKPPRAQPPSWARCSQNTWDIG